MKFTKSLISLFIAITLLIGALPISAAAYEHTEHTNLALLAVTEGIVLLKNDNNALPLNKNEKVALFGGGQIYTASTTSGYQIGGGGSGWVSSAYGTPMGPADALLAAQKEGKISIYEPLTQAYKNNEAYIPDAVMYNSAAEFADTAIMFITRYSKEGSDISVSEWSLSGEELSMMKTLSGKFEKLIVLLNTPSIISTDWSLDGSSYGVRVDALLSCYMGGEQGAEGMKRILLGEVNPSGKLTHTYAKSLYDYPTTTTFLESNEYVNYTEDIYVGYRYFETFARDKVAYPFGYGLSYTTFDIKTSNFSTADGKISIDVTVTNTGNVAGKEVVQVYYSAPQADTGAAVLSKSAIALGDYAKTDLLAPGESQTLKLSYPISYMASFDDVGKTGKKSCFVLEAGDYGIFVGNSVRNIASAGVYTVNALTVVSEHDDLVATNLTRRLNSMGEYESLPVVSITPEPDPVFTVSADKLNWIEAESGTPSANSAINTKESFGSTGYLYDGSKWHQLSSGIVLGNMNGKAGHNVKYKLNVETAGKYTVGFIIANGNESLSSAEDIFEIYVSQTIGLGTKQPVLVDAENTRGVGTDSEWFNFKFKTTDSKGKTYTVNLPKGEVTLTLCLTSKVNSGANPNIDKFVLIPEGKECSISTVLALYEGGDVLTNVDINKDNYKGITYADVESGKATLDELIAQMSYAELIQLCYGHTAGLASGTGTIGFASNAVAEKYGVYSADTADGPAGLRLSAKASIATFWPCATLQASTWNTALMEQIGQAVGDECLRYNADIWLAPGLNLHRNPLCGRNFEYYSEDPIVAGKSTAAVVNGVESRGVACAIKHFMANNKETNRKNLDSRVSQKAMREIYLRSFEIAIASSDPMCIMTSYNLINGTHTSANYDLLEGIVRGEWKYEGLIMTDWNTTPLITDEVLAGNNVTMPTGEPIDLAKSVDKGILSRGQLEKNAAYIINTLVKLPDHTVHLNRINEISASSATALTADMYSRKAYMTRFEIVGDSLCACYTENADEIDGTYGFIEFNIDVKTAGTYELSLKYATTSKVTNAFDILINGEPVSGITKDVTTTSSWSSFVQKKIGTVYLDAGVSTIRIQHKSATAVNYSALLTEFLSAEKHTHSFASWTKADETHHKRYCSCGAEDLAAHVWDDGTVSIEPTTEKTGIMTYACLECSRTKLESIPKLTNEETDAVTETIAETERISVETDEQIPVPDSAPATVYVIAGASISAIGIAIALILLFKKNKK